MDIIGFRTSSGSIYKFDPDTNYSTRLKISSGPGQGEWQQSCMCMFARDAKFEDFKADNFNPNASLRLGWLSPDKKTLNIIGTDNRLDNIPTDGSPVIALVDKTTRQATAALGTLMEPTMGFRPIEKFYNHDGTSLTHPGSAIDKVYTEPWDMNQDIDAALQNLPTHNAPPSTTASNAKQQFAQNAVNSPPPDNKPSEYSARKMEIARAMLNDPEEMERQRRRAQQRDMTRTLGRHL